MEKFRNIYKFRKQMTSENQVAAINAIQPMQAKIALIVANSFSPLRIHVDMMVL
jgi:hypothetical protein